MIVVLIPVLLFVAVQSTLGRKYEKDHHGTVTEERLSNKAK